MSTLHQQMRTARENNETARIEQLRTQGETLHTQMKAAHDRMDQQVRSILTSDQIAKLDQMRANHEKGGKGHGRHGGEGAGQQSAGS